MIPSKFYPTDTTITTFPYELTADISTIDFSTYGTKNDPAYPYYMGYIKEEDVPIPCLAMKVEHDAANGNLWHVKRAAKSQNYSWLYGMIYRNYGIEQSNHLKVVQSDGNGTVNYPTYSGSTTLRFINGGALSKTTYNDSNNHITIMVSYLSFNADGSYYQNGLYSDNSVIYTNIENLAKFINGEITYTVRTNATGNVELFYSQMDEHNTWIFTVGTRTVYVQLNFLYDQFQTRTLGTTTNTNATYCLVPFIKQDLNDTLISADTIYCNLPTNHNTISERVIPEIYITKEAFNVIAGTMDAIGGGTSPTDSYFWFNNEIDFDVEKINSFRYQTGYSDGVLFVGNGSNRYGISVGVDPKEWLKYYRLLNKSTYTNTLEHMWSNTYETGYSVNYFNDDNVPLYDGIWASETYQYSDIILNLQPWQYIDIDISVNNYDDADKPSPEPSPEPVDDEITSEKHNDENSLPILSGIRTVSGDAFSTFYRLSMYHVAELGHLLSQMPQTFWEALGTATDFKQSNLLDYLVSLKWYPLNIVDSSDTVTSDIQFGFNGIAKVTFTAAGTSYKVGNINRIYSMGSITVPYRASTQSFLDLEPYTTVSAYLPYIGTVSLQANDVLGYTITCTYVVDLTTGMCTGILDNGIDTIYIGTGKIGVDISVSGNDILTQSEKMASSYIGAASSAVNNALSLAASTAAEDAAGMISASASAITDMATSAIGIANSKRGIPETVGSASGFGGGYTHQSPYIKVQRPAVSIPGKYGHDVGYLSNRSHTIGSLSGYTVCSNPDLSGITATTAELDMIRSILCNGFYA